MYRNDLYRKTMELVYGFSNPDSTRVMGVVPKPLVEHRYVTPRQEDTSYSQYDVSSNNVLDVLRSNAIQGDATAIRDLTNLALRM